MSLNPQTIQRLPHVEAVVNYLAPMTEKPFNTYSLCFNPAHRCFYAPGMRAEEAILIKSYDSLHGVARFTPHSSFEDPTAPAAILPRESIEVRMLVFHRA